MPGAVGDLQPLDEILHIDEAPGAELGVESPSRNQVSHLAFPHRSHRGDIEGSLCVDELVSKCNDGLTEPMVAGDGAEFDQGLPLIGPCRPAGREVAPEGVL